jgi:hypothetical protein
MRQQLRVMLLVVCAIAVGLAGSESMFAQSGLGSVTATIVDETGGRLSGATLRLVEGSTGAARTTDSNEAGLITLPAVPPGTYTVTITRPDFKTRQIDNVTVNSFQQVSLGQITLELAVGATEVTEVSAERPVLDLDSGVRTETIQAQQVQDMPLQGRNWSTLLKVIPGSTPTNSEAINGREYSASGYADFRVNGKNPGQTQVNLDGGSLVDHGSDGKTTVAPSLESIQEVSVLTNNFQAEYGNRGGSVINIVTKSGTNTLRGAVFDYLRNEALNATSWENTFLGTPKPRNRFNYFGGNLGGPIITNKLFYFYNFENFKQDLPTGTMQGRVPTELERRGDFSQTLNADGTRPIIYMPGTQFSGTPVPFPNNVIPAAMLDPRGQAILNTYPLPNNPGDRNNNYILNYERKFPRRSHTAKVDWNVDDKTQAYVRFTSDGGTQVDRNLGSGGGILPAGNIQRPRPDRALAVNATHTFSNTFVMNALFGWSYDYVEWLPTDAAGLSKNQQGLAGLPTVFPATDDILPQVQIGTYPAYQFNRIPAYAKANEYQAAATFTWARGTHVIKFGGQTIINLKDEIDAGANKGNYEFAPSAGSAFDTGYAPANVLLGAVSRFTQIEHLNRKNSIYRDIHAFLQDTWKPASRLTLDYGVRFYHMPTEHNRNPEETFDGVFLPSRWDPAKAPRFYVPYAANTSLIVDPAFPNAPLPSNVANVLRYTIVPGSGDPLNGVVPLGGEFGNAGMPEPKALLFAPRGGFAWTPFASQRTLLRGGFGWAYNRNNIADTINRFENGLGGQANLAQTSFNTMASTSTLQPLQARSFGARDESNENVPTVYDYSVSVQQQLFGDFVLDIAYVGNIQKHQPVNFNINAIAPGTAFKSEFVDPRNAGFNFSGPITATNRNPLPGSNAMDPLVMRPYRGFNELMMTSNIADVTYNALQVSASKRLRNGFAIDASYTLSRTKGQVEGVGLFDYNWEDYTGYRLNSDRLHVVSVSTTYETPRLANKLRFDNPVGRAILDDWKIAHLFTAFSSTPISPAFNLQLANQTSTLSAADLNRVFLGTPDLAPRLVVNGDVNQRGELANQFDPTQLGVPGLFPAADGTGPRNFINGRGSFSNDISFVKQFRIGDGPRFEVRANVFNVFNNVRRLAINNTLQFKANGANFGDGFQLFNTPDQLEARARANGITDPLQLYNQFRSGVGHVNLTDVQPSRVIEIGMALRF